IPEVIPFIEESKTEELIRVLKALPAPPILIIIDTLARSISGFEENSSQAMSTLIGMTDRIRSALGAAVLFIHHTTKSNKREERGSGHLRGAADMMAVVTSAKSILTVSCEKAKDYARFAPMQFSLVLCGASCVVVPLESA